MQNYHQLISDVAQDVKNYMHNAEGGHDWWHIHRVWQNAKLISRSENVDHLVVEMAALLHDIADPKFHNGDELIGPTTARKMLSNHRIDADRVNHIVNIITFVSFKNNIEGTSWTSQELEVVQDADRLDAIGAIGIARAFNYGGFKNRAIYDPHVPPLLHMTKTQYQMNTGPTLNHFYEKLFKLKDLMNTRTGQQLAKERHDFMINFVEQFFKEVGGPPSWHFS